MVTDATGCSEGIPAKFAMESDISWVSLPAVQTVGGQRQCCGWCASRDKEDKVCSRVTRDHEVTDPCPMVAAERKFTRKKATKRDKWVAAKGLWKIVRMDWVRDKFQGCKALSSRSV